MHKSNIIIIDQVVIIYRRSKIFLDRRRKGEALYQIAVNMQNIIPLGRFGGMPPQENCEDYTFSNAIAHNNCSINIKVNDCSIRVF